MLIREFRTPAEFWAGMVEPDYRDALANPVDLRAAFHAAISLYHLHDWVWHFHECVWHSQPVRGKLQGGQLRSNFSYWDDGAKKVLPVHHVHSFAKSLERCCADFGRIWGIANAAKHLQLIETRIRPIPDPVRRAEDTAVHQQGGASGGYGVGDIAYNVAGSYVGPARVVILENREFGDIAKAVHGMWSKLAAKYNWW